MKAGWEGNLELQALVAAKDNGAMLHPEIVEVEDSHIKDLKSEWSVASSSGGTPVYLDSGGATIQASNTALVAEVANDGSTLNNLSHVPTYHAVLVTWSGSQPEDIEIYNMVARLDPRRDGGVAKNVSVWEAQLFRVTRLLQGGIEEGGFTMSPISRPVRVDAAGEAAADFTFNFVGLGGHQYPRVGLPPTGGLTDANPRTLVRIIGLQDDGSPATNVAWMANSGQSSATSAGVYTAEAVSVLSTPNVGATESGGSALRISTGADYPEFTLGQSDYTATVLTFTGANEVPDLTGAGDLVIVARGEEPSDSAITYEIDDGTGYVECADGDIIGTDNTAQGGEDLSGVSTTGPWDIRVTLTPSTAADLNAPTVREFGVERIVSTWLTGAARLEGGHRQVEPVTLKGNIAEALLVIQKTGEQDFRDYGSNVLAENHIGEIHIRFWLAPTVRSDMDRRKWMLHSVWDIDDYRSSETHHVVTLVSPLRRLRVIIPPFVVSSGTDGTRTAAEVPSSVGTIKDAYDEILDTFVALAGRLRGAGPDDDTNNVQKTIERADAKDELDRLAYLSGGAIIESQGRVKFVKMMRDGPGADTPVAFFPLDVLEVGDLGPGYSTRTDEFFVRFNWNNNGEFFEDERRYLNSVALDKLGGVGVNTTQQLDEETCEWITSTTLADLVGKRVPYHFATGLMVWRIRSTVAHPALEPGDVVAVETTRFVGRSPLSDEEVRGRVSALAVITQVRDPWGTEFEVWVPSFDKIVPADGTVAQIGLGFGGVLHRDTSTRSHTGDTSATEVERYTVPVTIYPEWDLYVKARWVVSGSAGTKTVTAELDDGTVTPTVAEWQFAASDTVPVDFDFVVITSGSSAGTSSAPIQGSTLRYLPTNDFTVELDVVFSIQLANAADTAQLIYSEVGVRRRAA